ncbi:hypothetical protein DOTSEDRAFT_68858 [Lecanosticta acicola]|uniref:Glutaredoxin domain-containing protein n=1 Tax=Lecanosticta acicola TaxID=111012 RepID=A0AAI8YWQ5_9PEZI|nr:hypothetical protein DOTSEDRAFT_68858 [Lecanosticta acicola]
MPSGRQYRAIGLVALLTILVLYYVSNGERLTHNSEFYQKTLAALENKKDAEVRQHLIEEEKQRLERVERLQKEHDAAMATVTSALASIPTKSAAVGPAPENQKPMVDESHEAESKTEKTTGGRKKMKDGKKIVDEKPASDSDDGVAKVGNVGAKSSAAAKGQKQDPGTEEAHKVELELNGILKKGPIIIFSKSYCPFSKKAKHILLDMYNITPAPYVVELDHHELGSGIQEALQKSTGRRTVPNVLINGKSIGGGDDITALHQSGKIVDTIKSMGGKRIVSISSKPEEKAEVKFKS